MFGVPGGVTYVQPAACCFLSSIVKSVGESLALWHSDVIGPPQAVAALLELLPFSLGSCGLLLLLPRR